MTATNELHADIVKLTDYGQNFTLTTPVLSKGKPIPLRRIVTIVDYVPTKDNPFNLADNIDILYVRKYVDGEWFWVRDGVSSPHQRYLSMNVADIITEITGLF